MARASVYWVMQRPYNSVVDTAKATDDFLVKAPEWRQAMMSAIGNQSVSPNILAALLVEGVDFPFSPHRWVYETDAQAAEFTRREAVGAGFVSTLGLGIPPNLLMSPLGDPFVQSETHAFPAAALVKRARDAAWAAYAAGQAARGSWIFAIPATAYTIPVCQVLDEVQYHLLEGANEGATWSPLWTQTEVLKALNLRIARFLMETSILVEHVEIAVGASPAIIALPGDLIQIKRVAWVSGGVYSELPRVDPLQLDVVLPTWDSTGGTPQVYTEVPDAPLEIRLGPVPAVAGTLDLFYVKAPAPVGANCDIMPLPDEWVWAVKYGVLADLFGKEGEANDPERAGYCEQRYSEGVVLARLFQGLYQ